METKKIAFLSHNIQECYRELLEKAYQKDPNFENYISDLILNLVADKHDYDDILNKYQVTKTVINRLLFSKFLEVNYYRKINNVPLDKSRLEICNAFEKIYLQSSIPLFVSWNFNPHQIIHMINDVALYLYTYPEQYRYHITEYLIAHQIHKPLYLLYPFGVCDHIATINQEFSPKEKIIGIIKEAITLESEKIQFAEGVYPLADSHYHLAIEEILQKCNGRNRNLPNVHHKIEEYFKHKLDLHDKDIYYKMLVIELAISIIKLKREQATPLRDDEEGLLYFFQIINSNIEALINLYDTSSKQLITIFNNNWRYLSNSQIFEDLPELRKIKEKIKK